MKQLTYTEARSRMSPGDVIAFSGNGAVSNIIKRVTNSPVSHVGVIMQTNISGQLVVNRIIESNSKQRDTAGVHVWRMSERVDEYDGCIWWLPVDIPFKEKKFFRFLLTQKGKKYDVPQAIASALDRLPDTKEDLDRLFCSELVTAALKHVDVVRDVNASEMTPADVCWFDIYSDIYQIKGTPTEIKKAVI